MKVFISVGRLKLGVQERVDYFHGLIAEERPCLCACASYLRKRSALYRRYSLLSTLEIKTLSFGASDGAKLKIPVFPKSFRLWYKAYILIHNN
jgi:hypothetical protein